MTTLRTCCALVLAAAFVCTSPAQAAEIPLIVVDQFGYLPDQPKIAVLREPLVGFDAGVSYKPGGRLEVVDAKTGTVVLTGSAEPWRGGAVDPSSGDRAWSFDFSALKTPGRYEVVDPEHGVLSPPFRISAAVYRPILVQAVRMLFYQRAGYPKSPPFAAAPWIDAASHLGPGQDTEARLFSARNDPSTARDLHGGWYDAGDFNRYTPWAARDVVQLLHAYLESPGVWTDDYGIPESGNGVPDLLDEVKWELDWLVRMQNPDGSMLSILGVSHASPPSAANARATTARRTPSPPWPRSAPSRSGPRSTGLTSGSGPTPTTSPGAPSGPGPGQPRIPT